MVGNENFLNDTRVQKENQKPLNKRPQWRKEQKDDFSKIK